jgi:hypothetical protein
MIKFHTGFELLWFSIKHANTYAEAIMDKRKLHTFVSDLITNHIQFFLCNEGKTRSNRIIN